MTFITRHFSKRRRFWTVAAVTVAMGSAVLGRTTEAAEESRAILKTYFETGDIPTEEEFSNLIDSFISRIDDGVYIYDGATPDPVGQGELLGIGTEVGPGSFFPVSGLGEAWVGRSGFLGLSLELDSQTHYGYLQITSAPGDQYPMFVEHIVYETEPNTPIIATHIPVPEPTTLALLGLGLASLSFARRRKVA